MEDFGPEVYRNPQIQSTLVEGYPVVIAEVGRVGGGPYPRTHQRIIGADETNTAGRTIIYSDTYVGAPGDPAYAYARHDVGQANFFRVLEEFLTTAILVELPELRDAVARCVVQTEDGIDEVEYKSYLLAVHTLRSIPLRFARLYFPFGDMTVEFRQRALVENEFQFIDQEALIKQLQSPLFAFDASRSEIWIPFLATIHWARTLIEPSVLQSILRMAARAYA